MSYRYKSSTTVQPPHPLPEVTFKSIPHDKFLVDINDGKLDRTEPFLWLESYCFKLIWTAPLVSLQGESISKGNSSIRAIVHVFKNWLTLDSKSQKKKSTTCQVDLKHSVGGSMILLIVIRDSLSGRVSGYWWHLCPLAFGPERSVDATMQHLSKDLDAGDSASRILSIRANITLTGHFAV
ncbi:hypothetical protein LEN26_001674 [Aphanomyces euteiches]|nr:hypothetical protein AeMF1_018632 [Aphanomyces euteiches]KAH9160892.1 hypothetical protein LEN26_001674 [Aphanomyces euteiches]KAH9194422.1 hypothetical protein AeNC1_003603 [Aphanomyces euteiches]